MRFFGVVVDLRNLSVTELVNKPRTAAYVVPRGTRVYVGVARRWISSFIFISKTPHRYDNISRGFGRGCTSKKWRTRPWKESKRVNLTVKQRLRPRKNRCFRSELFDGNEISPQFCSRLIFIHADRIREPCYRIARHS